MRNAKSVFGVIGALIPVLYCVGFLIYFAGVERWTGVQVGNALGPTIVGLGVVALLFAIPLVLRIVRLFGGPPGPPGRRGPTEDALQAQPGDFDPDAAIARYLAQRDPSGSPPDDAPPPRPGFGRKRG